MCDKDGVPARVPLERAAARGSVNAAAQLVVPSYPDALDYLREWAYELHGRSGVGMSGVAPLSYSTIIAWSRLTQTRPTAFEVHALLRLDSALCAPGRGD